MMKIRFAATALAAALALTACSETPPTALRRDTTTTTAADTGAGRYIVVLKNGADPSDVANRTVSRYGGTLHYTYHTALKGFAATLTADGVRAMHDDPRVGWIERDGIMHVDGTQSSAPWGLDRIDQRKLPLTNTYGYTTTGAGVHVYIIDTGIRTTHTEFGGRASIGHWAGSFADGVDCNGHGTHVAGTIGGATYGVAKGATLVAVRVFGCTGSGYTSDVIDGVDWVAQHAVLPAVANMSLGGGASASLNYAVEYAISAGVVVAVAAGNDNVDACTESPSRAPDALTVGASDIYDTRAYFSNWGSCVDLFAPGVNITSAWIGSDVATNTISGTSMATPHAAGVAAVWLEDHAGWTPSATVNQIVRSGSSNKLEDIPDGTPNVLLFSKLTLEQGRIRLGSSSLDFFKMVAAPTFTPPAMPASISASAPVRFPGHMMYVQNPWDPQTVELKNFATGPVNWTANINQPWATVSPSSGTLAANATVLLKVTLHTSGMPGGTYEGLLRVSSPDASNGPIYTTLRLGLLPGGTLTSGVPVTNIYGDVRDNARWYRIVVPPGSTGVTFTTSGGTGDVDMGVNLGGPPNASDDFWCVSATTGNSETCGFTGAVQGEWWVELIPYQRYTGVSLTATVTP